MKILGTPLCIMCDKAEERLKEENIPYEYFNFTESIENLKEFLYFRDTHSEFDEAKATKHVGIPCFVFDDGTFTFDIAEVIRREKR